MYVNLLWLLDFSGSSLGALWELVAVAGMADSVTEKDIDAVLTNASWEICSTYHTVLKASPGAKICCLISRS